MSELRSIRVLAIDFDGTIANSMPPQEHTWRQAVRLVVGDPNLEKIIIGNLYEGRSGEKMFKGTNLSGDIKSKLRMEKNKMWHASRNDTPLFDKANEVLRALSQRIPIWIATTADREYVEAVLKREALSDCFSGIVTDRDVMQPKPAKDMIVKIATASAAEIAAICLVGDSANDWEMSKNSGCKFALLKTTPFWPIPEADTKKNGAIIAENWLELRIKLFILLDK